MNLKLMLERENEKKKKKKKKKKIMLSKKKLFSFKVLSLSGDFYQSSSNKKNNEKIYDRIESIYFYSIKSDFDLNSYIENSTICNNSKNFY